jgi:DNA segregation ATPase FtsK/SpoIIIE, S-DNA-T family
MTDTATGEELALPATPVEPGQLETATPPVYADITDRTGQRVPIISAKFQRQNIRGTLTRAAGLHGHRAAYHGLRLHWYTLKTVWFAVLGARNLTGRLMVWWHWTHGWALESQAVAAGRSGHADAIRAHEIGRKTRTSRAQIIAAVLAAVTVAGLAAWQWLPRWCLIATAAAAVLVLARHGKPNGTTLVSQAVVPPQYQPPTPEIITRAFGSLQIKAINDIIAAGQKLAFVSDVAESGPGWGCQLDLPYGVTPTMILARREQLASGLRRPLSATWPAAVAHEHAGRLELWIGFHDLSKAKPIPWPLLKSGETDIFAGVPFGTDPRGRNVPAPLFEVNWLIGAAPGQGKTAAVRVLACSAALDVTCDLWIHELAGKGDLEPLAQVAHRYTSGLDEESLSYVAESVRLLRRELERRSAAFKKLEKHERPDGKITRALAEKRGLRLRPLVCVIDEFQNAVIDPAHGKQIADDVAYIIRLGRAYGVILILATQRPDSESCPTSISGIVSARMCLKVPDQIANDLILGTGSYKAGYNATIFRAKTDAGLGWLKGDGDPQIVRTYYLDEPAARRVATRARMMREKAGVLTGYALGEDDTAPARSFAADVIAAFGTDTRLWSETIAERMREFPGYGDITADAVASQLRAMGVNVRDVRETGRGIRKGAQRAEIEAVAGSREA